MRPIKALCLLLILLAALGCGEAWAACSISITSINFGVYDVFAASPTDSVGTVTVSCTNTPPGGVRATISIGSSPNSGSFNPRRMKRSGGTDLLDYNLFTTSSRTTVWGDGTAGTSPVTTPRVRNGRPATMNVYGRIPAGRDVSVGSYSDTLVVTVTP